MDTTRPLLLVASTGLHQSAHSKVLQLQWNGGRGGFAGIARLEGLKLTIPLAKVAKQDWPRHPALSYQSSAGKQTFPHDVGGVNVVVSGPKIVLGWFTRTEEVVIVSICKAPKTLGQVICEIQRSNNGRVFAVGTLCVTRRLGKCAWVSTHMDRRGRQNEIPK
jgi:hypothetical protein